MTREANSREKCGSCTREKLDQPADGLDPSPKLTLIQPPTSGKSVIITTTSTLI